MPPSQLKRLKTSLREQGVTGPQKSKKQKQQDRAGRTNDSRVQRNAALQQIRDSFNPFEIKANNRPAKFQSFTAHPKKDAVLRPGVTRSMGEEARRATLLPEIQRRNKTGGIIDRRIGENDPTMTPEERALQRFAQEKMRKKGGASLFDLEADDDFAEDALTHGGQALDLDRDDFDMEGLEGSDDESDRGLKRRRSSAGEEDEDEEMSDVEGQDPDKPARKKSKAEVMKEVIAKSKMHKYERQKNKEDDDDLREELDQGLQEMLNLLRGVKPPPKAEKAEMDAGMNPERLAMLQSKSREETEREYDVRLRQMAMDKRAAPTTRTKTEEEQAIEEAYRLKEMEQSRLRRMQGEESEEEEVEEKAPKDNKKKKEGVEVRPEDEDNMRDDAADFGLPTQQYDNQKEAVVHDDEDEFLMEDDLIASESDVDVSDESEDEEDSDAEEGAAAAADEEDEEDEFVRGILGDKDEKSEKKAAAPAAPSGLAYTYECPRSHEEMLTIFNKMAVENIPVAVQRIRALYHPSLLAENKQKLADFSTALVDHISYMAKEKQSLAVIETLIRHLHSLSRTYPGTIGKAFRTHMSAMHESGTFNAGDLIILTAVSSIYPTSDHFHQVVTPAITLMGRWLEMTPPTTSNLATGAFIVALCIKYQSLSKRYIPEAVRYTVKALQLRPQPSEKELQPHVNNLLAMADLWSAKTAFGQIFSPAALTSLQALKGQKKSSQHLSIMLSQARLRRRPLELHHHRPLPIRTSIPKFEENFNPDKHYDPDRERADAAKLKKEYKRERKGAVRELRKDANFIAREQLRDKKERDAEYEKKYKRLVAEIQGEEGHEAKEYEREKRMRKSKR
ncbi:Nop14-like protein [Aureobasidium pullulans]|uniref:Nop14-like protein n=1 Tax=Aureobasidium pullulans TaxID=5580 RepID=A0A4V4JF08_AURPU|nr:Nop14-like protein [Aureobasidium pullulans]THX65382.1 Nop14-like protein [Aureobasidium pullulans]THZ46365.1 Nop14-like protein [Aureobasidium pullulans]